MEGTVDFTPLLLVSALAVVIPFVTWRLTGGLLPAVVGEVVLGMVFGNSVLGLIDENEWLTFLALFGFAYLMFPLGAGDQSRRDRAPAGRSVVGSRGSAASPAWSRRR